jgi:hypothetical protein
MEAIKIFVGADRSQALAVRVLEHSIKKHTEHPVQVTAMLDLPIRAPKDPRQGQRTGFSFSRFCIPKMCGYLGRAIYMDADMLVLKDIANLWAHPISPKAKIVIQADLTEGHQKSSRKVGGPIQRVRQTAVMLLDCQKLDWEIEAIIDLLDQNKMTYEQLMYEMALLKEEEIQETLPFEWNSLEHCDPNTCNIHYTDMSTQPWVSSFNRYGNIWFAEVREMVEEGSISVSEIQGEIALGYFRPSFFLELNFGHKVPQLLRPFWSLGMLIFDKSKGFVRHRAVNEAKRIRHELMQKYLGSVK